MQQSPVFVPSQGKLVSVQIQTTKGKQPSTLQEYVFEPPVTVKANQQMRFAYNVEDGQIVSVDVVLKNGTVLGTAHPKKA